MDTSTKDFVPADVWLPKTFPAKVRVIVSYTIDKSGEGPKFHDFFQLRQAPMLKISHNFEIVQKVTEHYFSGEMYLSE